MEEGRVRARERRAKAAARKHDGWMDGWMNDDDDIVSANVRVSLSVCARVCAFEFIISKGRKDERNMAMLC